MFQINCAIHAFLPRIYLFFFLFPLLLMAENADDFSVMPENTSNVIYSSAECKITFIIPSINRDTLVDSVDSLLKQSNPNWKCIIIYDGVDGKTFDDERITTIKIDKTGWKNEAGMVRDHGIVLADTEWIGFLDDDDTLHPDYVKTLLEKYSDYDFVVWRMQYATGKILPPLWSDYLQLNEVGISFCYKNKFDGLLFSGNIAGEDFYFIQKLISLTNNYKVAPEVYYFIRH